MQNKNPFENILKRTESYSVEVQKMQSAFDDFKRKRVDITQREAILAKDKENLTNQELRIQSDLVSLLNTVTSYLNETVVYSNEMYRRSQTEVLYRMQAEASQRALAETAQKALADAAERAKAEAEYRKQTESAQKQLISQAQKAQVDAAKRIQAELNYPAQNTQNSSPSVETFEPKNFDSLHSGQSRTGKTGMHRKMNNTTTDSDIITIESITSNRLGNSMKKRL